MGICISILFGTEFGEDAVLSAMPLALRLGYSARDVRTMFNFFHSCDIDGSGSVSITGEIIHPFLEDLLVLISDKSFIFVSLSSNFHLRTFRDERCHQHQQQGVWASRLSPL